MWMALLIYLLYIIYISMNALPNCSVDGICFFGSLPHPSVTNLFGKMEICYTALA
ncbi:hypothetical protein Sjap_021066 [Stephania japonica]|uniref:Uncharacterized protein n=1 Tax=Stephania japonica TaxID=461633 RepID=A0AAP0HZJ2_9MAGN